MSRPRIDLRPEYSPAALTRDVVEVLAEHGITVELDPAMAYVADIASADLLRALGVRPATAARRG